MMDSSSKVKQEQENVKKQQLPTYSQAMDYKVKNYQIELLQPLRLGKKLLVLDLDLTLSDFEMKFVKELARPYLYTFMASAYNYYDIVIWSATSSHALKQKLSVLGLLNHPSFKIAFILDMAAAFRLYNPMLGAVLIKPLELIWRRFPWFNSHNTIMVDDNKRNFLKNPNNGIAIKPYRKELKDTDNELLKMATYLKVLGMHANNSYPIDQFDHCKWEKVVAQTWQEIKYNQSAK